MPHSSTPHALDPLGNPYVSEGPYPPPYAYPGQSPTTPLPPGFVQAPPGAPPNGGGQESSLLSNLLPILAGLGMAGVGFGVGRNPAVHDPTGTFTRPLEAIGHIQGREIQAKHYQDQAKRDTARFGLEQNKYRLDVQEGARKDEAAQRRAKMDRYILSRLPGGAGQGALQGQPLPPQPSMQPFTTSPTTEAEALPQVPSGPTEPPPPPQGRGVAPTQAPPAPLGAPQRKFKEEISIRGGEPGLTFTEVLPSESHSEVMKVSNDYIQFLQQYAPMKGTPQYNAAEAGFQGKLAELSRVQFQTPAAGLAQDIRLLTAISPRGADPDVAKAVNGLRKQAGAVGLGEMKSTVGQMIKERQLFTDAGLTKDASTMEQAIGAALRPPDQASHELAFTGQYSRLSSDFVTKKTNYVQMAKAYQDSLVQPTGVNDSTMIFAYMKMVDPTSVVREAEYDRAAKMASVPEWLRQYFMPDGRVLAGTVVAPEIRKKLLDGATGILSSAIPVQMRDVETVYSRLSQKYGYSPIHPFSGLPTPQAVADQTIAKAGGDLTLAKGLLVLGGYNYMDIR